MHDTARLTGRFHAYLKTVHGHTLFHTALTGHFNHRGYGTIPYDIIYIYFIAKEHLFATVGIDHSHQTIAMMTEEIEEITVLTELVSIGRVVHRAIVISENNDKSTTNQPAQFGTAVHVCFFRE